MVRVNAQHRPIIALEYQITSYHFFVAEIGSQQDQMLHITHHDNPFKVLLVFRIHSKETCLVLGVRGQRADILTDLPANTSSIIPLDLFHFKVIILKRSMFIKVKLAEMPIEEHISDSIQDVRM